MGGGGNSLLPIYRWNCSEMGQEGSQQTDKCSFGGEGSGPRCFYSVCTAWVLQKNVPSWAICRAALPSHTDYTTQLQELPFTGTSYGWAVHVLHNETIQPWCLCKLEIKSALGNFLRWCSKLLHPNWDNGYKTYTFSKLMGMYTDIYAFYHM